MQSIQAENFHYHNDLKHRKISTPVVNAPDAYLSYELEKPNGAKNIMKVHEVHIPDTLKGSGLEDQLPLEAIEFADKMNYKLKPKCPAMQSYMNRHPELAYLKA
jgi:predicted GNAT family acetyltransferase